MRRYRFLLLIIITAALLLLQSCTKRTDALIDSSGSVPVIAAVSISPDTINTDLIGTHPSPNDTLGLSFKLQAKVVDPDGESAISSVSFLVLNTHSQSTLAQGLLLDNGITPDSRSNDSLFSASAVISLPRSYIGPLTVVIQGTGTNGLLSSSIITPVTITRADHAPVIDSISIPDTIHVAQATSMTITVYASDTDGVGDVSSVYQYVTNNTYRLTDNGDGSFSRTISWSASNFPLSFLYTYVYTFVAYDYSGKASSVITKTLVVVP